MAPGARSPGHREDQPHVVVPTGGDHRLDCLGRHEHDPFVAHLRAGWHVDERVCDDKPPAHGGLEELPRPSLLDCPCRRLSRPSSSSSAMSLAAVRAPPCGTLLSRSYRPRRSSFDSTSWMMARSIRLRSLSIPSIDFRTLLRTSVVWACSNRFFTAVR